jgi:hypothetical protein
MRGSLRGLVVVFGMVALAGCGSDSPADQFLELTEQFCACKNEECRSAVRAKVAAFDKSQLDSSDYETLMEARDTVDRCAALPIRQSSAASSPIKKSRSAAGR